MTAKLLAFVFAVVVSMTVAQAQDTAPYYCVPGPPAYHDIGVLAPGESKVLDLAPDCAGVTDPDNFNQLIIGVTTPTGEYIKVTGKDMLAKLGLTVDLIDTESGVTMFAQEQVCRYSAGLSYEFYNPQPPRILRPVTLLLANVSNNKSYQVHSTVTWVYKPEGAPVENCLRFGGEFM